MNNQDVEKQGEMIAQYYAQIAIIESFADSLNGVLRVLKDFTGPNGKAPPDLKPVHIRLLRDDLREHINEMRKKGNEQWPGCGLVGTQVGNEICGMLLQVLAMETLKDPLYCKAPA